MAYKAPFENRINFNWHYQRDFICHCDKCIEERKALEDLKNPHGHDQTLAPESPEASIDCPGPIGISVWTQTDCIGPKSHNCPGTTNQEAASQKDERMCTEPECRLYKERYLKMWFELQELGKAMKKSQEAEEKIRLIALE